MEEGEVRLDLPKGENTKVTLGKGECSSLLISDPLRVFYALFTFPHALTPFEP